MYLEQQQLQPAKKALEEAVMLQACPRVRSVSASRRLCLLCSRRTCVCMGGVSLCRCASVCYGQGSVCVSVSLSSLEEARIRKVGA